MSKYTTEVRYICEMNSGFPVNEMDKYTPDQIIDASRSKIFNFSYPIFEESHRPELEKKILKHYYTREIGLETYALWQLKLNDRLNLIMPKYNNLYSAEKEILNKAFANIDVDTINHTTDNENVDKTFNETEGSNVTNTHNDIDTKKYSDTPQGSITFNEANKEHYWLTDYTELENNGGYNNQYSGNKQNTGNTKSNGRRDFGQNEKGYRGGKVYFELMSEYEEKIVNIDMKIVNELKDLFFLLW